MLGSRFGIDRHTPETSDGNEARFLKFGDGRSMAFKFGSASSVSLDSPERMFLDFSDRRLNGLLTHQGKIISDYLEKGISKRDVALRLPTGSGKTLVGLLIADWRRRKFNERVVYVCPTNQLVHQVVAEASEKYGMSKTVRAFTGTQREYESSAKAMFQSAELIAVTSYGGLFNANTFFKDPNFILLDDAHASENYLASFWSLPITREDAPRLFNALAGVVSRVLPPLDARRVGGARAASWDQSWVDLIPAPSVVEIEADIVDVIDVHVPETHLRYRWALLRDKLHACQVYVSGDEITIRPLIPPSLRYQPFANAKQRLYMSATLGEGGDLERLVGVKEIFRLSLPDEFSSQGVGRRFFIFPGRSLSEEDQEKLQSKAIRKTNRAVILVPDFRSAKKIETTIQREGIETFSAADLEDNKSRFVHKSRAVAVLANRYDGIDFPDDQCRLLLMRGLPGATGLQERFMLDRLGARLILQDRIRTRVIQAVGRCTRSLTDYSAVIILGENLLTYLSKSETREMLHPELQAEISFGLDQGGTIDEMLENLDLFLARGDEWNAAESEIRRRRGEARLGAASGLEQLAATAPQEVEFQYALWDGDGATALGAARTVLGTLTDPALKGYRAHWTYLAGCAASRLARDGLAAHDAVARDFFSAASRAAPALGWLRRLAGVPSTATKSEVVGESAAPLLPRIEALFGQLGTLHGQKYSAFEKKILDGLASTHASTFEEAHKNLGILLGFDAGKEESTGAPDPWWLVDESLCFVFEDHSDADPASKVSVTKARQVSTHPAWIRKRFGLGGEARLRTH